MLTDEVTRSADEALLLKRMRENVIYAAIPQPKIHGFVRVYRRWLDLHEDQINELWCLLISEYPEINTKRRQVEFIHLLIQNSDATVDLW